MLILTFYNFLSWDPCPRKSSSEFRYSFLFIGGFLDFLKFLVLDPQKYVKWILIQIFIFKWNFWLFKIFCRPNPSQEINKKLKIRLYIYKGNFCPISRPFLDHIGIEPYFPFSFTLYPVSIHAKIISITLHIYKYFFYLIL